MISLATLLVVLIPSITAAQFPPPDQKLVTRRDSLLVDYAYFRGSAPDTARLELYFQIRHSLLEFSRSGDNLTAAYSLEIVVKDDDDRVMDTFDRNRQIVLGADEESRTRTDFRSSQVSLEVPLGKYTAHFTLIDKSSGKKIVADLKMKVENLYSDQPRLSTVEFLQAFERRAESQSLFTKGDMIVVPVVHRVYGSMDNNRVAYYYEIYAGEEAPEKVVVETKIRHYRRGMIYRDTVHLDLSQDVHRQLREISLADFTPGTYELEILLRGRRNKKLANRSTEFIVAWTEEGMIRNDWSATLQQLRLFSEDVDVSDMEDLESYEDRLRAFQQFWRDRDPTDGTEENEAKVAFYYRISVANQLFGILQRDGWRTDRGRIYVQYGEPDYLTDEPFSIDALPYQIWHYVNMSPVRNFLFVDEKGDGDYRLQYPYDGIGTSYGF